MPLSDQVAIVTGGARGIGRSIALALAGKAATVIAAMAAGIVGMAGFALAIALAKPLTGGSPFLLSLPPHAFWVLGLGNLPAAFFLSALLLALGTFARSSREGQTYAAYLQMPLLLPLHRVHALEIRSGMAMRVTEHKALALNARFGSQAFAQSLEEGFGHGATVHGQQNRRPLSTVRAQHQGRCL